MYDRIAYYNGYLGQFAGTGTYQSVSF